VPNERQRREAERRRLRRQLQRRAEREARRRRFAMIASIVGTLVIIAVIIIVVTMTNNDSSSNPPAAGGHVTSSSPTTPTTSTSAALKAYPCTWEHTGTPPAKQVSPPQTTKPPRSGKVNILVNSTQGNMTFQLERSLAPCAVASFASLAEQRYFDGSPCHRLTTANIYVLQCGDPTGSGSGGPGYSFFDELTGHEKYTRGVLAMANSGPNTNGSQFFIVYKDTQLPPSYTIFGKVTTGMNVVDKVAAAGSDNSNGQGDGKPKLPITLTSVGVVQ
jgi:peptidyl-prolyl cis-trans isomerase B (cyclophilin B)